MDFLLPINMIDIIKSGSRLKFTLDMIGEIDADGLQKLARRPAQDITVKIWETNIIWSNIESLRNTQSHETWANINHHVS